MIVKLHTLFDSKTLFFSLLYPGHFPGTGSVQVLEFQKDGVASPWTMAEYRGQLDRNWNMNSLTLCARFQIFFLQVRATFFQLQDTIDGLDAQILGRKQEFVLEFLQRNI